MYDIMKKKYGRIGIATIYRTLEHLIDTKEITKLVGVFDKAYFERNK
ncbi:transcriptional repressor [Patescibacteria group bacterium]|nr:transcriptional repressor [Patescibacteria group bacterium]